MVVNEELLPINLDVRKPGCPLVGWSILRITTAEATKRPRRHNSAIRNGLLVLAAFVEMAAHRADAHLKEHGASGINTART